MSENCKRHMLSGWRKSGQTVVMLKSEKCGETFEAEMGGR
jgi:hypothetical protein